jgi:polyhydroxyalkanoate synthesis regulator phasin
VVKDAVRGYLGLAGGLTEVTAARARAAARALVEQSEETASQVSALAEDLMATSRRNRESLVQVVRHEVEQAVRRLGLGAAGDVDALMQRVRRLERTLRELQADQSRSGTTSTDAPAAKDGQAPAKKAAAKKSPAKKTTATKSAGKKSTAKATTKTSTTKRTSRRTTTRRTAAKKTTRRRSSS